MGGVQAIDHERRLAPASSFHAPLRAGKEREPSLSAQCMQKKRRWIDGAKPSHPTNAVMHDTLNAHSWQAR